MRESYTNGINQTWYLYGDYIDPKGYICKLEEFVLSPSQHEQMYARVEYADGHHEIHNVIMLHES